MHFCKDCKIILDIFFLLKNTFFLMIKKKKFCFDYFFPQKIYREDSSDLWFRTFVQDESLEKFFLFPK